MAVAASTFTGVNLADIPAPDVVETIAFETLLGDWLTTFQGYCTDEGVDYNAILESDPAYKLLEVGAYREMVMRQRINDGAKAVMAAYAEGSDLDNLAALLDVERYVLTPDDATQGITEVDEGDPSLRQRMVLAPQSYSVAGPEGAYASFGLSADSSVKDVSIVTPTPDDITGLVMQVLSTNGASSALSSAMQTALGSAIWPGTVEVTVLADTDDGTPSAATLAAVASKLNAQSIRPMTDNVVVSAPGILGYAIAATLEFLEGYDQATVIDTANTALTAYLAKYTALGAAHTRAGIIGAIMSASGMKNVDLLSPAQDITPTLQQAANCTGITLTPDGFEA